MNAPEPTKLSLRAPAHLMTSGDYRDSLRRLHPVVYVDGRRVESVADEAALAPGVQALGVSYDYALDPALAPLMLATQGGNVVPRMLAVDESAGDLLNKLDAVRVLCQETKMQVVEYDGRIELIPERDIKELRGFLKGIHTEFEREEDRV